jgi:hypothetical protein
MVSIDIKTNFAAVFEQLNQLEADVRDQAVVSAVNKTMAKSKTNMIRAITREFNVKSGYVRDRLNVERARFVRGRAVVEAILNGSGARGRKRSANLIAFLEKSTSLAQARKRAKTGTANQLHFQIKRTGSRVVIRGAFIGNKGRTVFIREGKSRLPIKALQTIDIPQMFNTKRINAVVVQAIKEDFPEIFKHEAKFYWDRFNARKTR